jgi:CPA2 family monovalent cation:H+ antiporter-2
MTGSQVLGELVIVLGTAAVITLLFQLVKLPVVLGYVVAGAVIGPHVSIPLVANAGLVHVLSELGIIMLMFSLGLELRISTIARVGVGAGLTALFEVALVLTVGALVAGLLGFSSTEAVFAGACLAISSTMLVAKAFEDLGWKGGFTEVVFAILVFEDLIAIILLAVLTGLASGAGLEAHELAVTLGKLAGFLIAMLVGGMLLVPRLVRFLAKRGQPETLLIVALAICFGLAILTERVGYPVALGAFVAGLVVAESGLGHEVGERVKPFRDVFAMMFFVSIGMQIDPAQLVEELPTIFVFTALVLVFKPLGVGFGSFAAGRGVQTSMRAGLSLAQNGELSFVIAGIGIASGVVRPSLLAIAVGVTCLTTLTSAVMIRGSEPLADWFAARLPGRFTTFVSFYESWLDRLRSRRDTAWHRVRRPVVVLAIDTAAVVVIVIGGSILGPRAIYSTGLSGFTANAIIAVAVIALSAPFGLGAVRRVVQIARMLALIVIPEGGEVDLGRAPRRALTLMLELAIAAVVTIPVVATIQPFTGTASLVVGGVVVFLIAITYRSIVDFTQHVHAGSELILELMKSAPEETATIGPQIETMLPGFGGLVSITLADTSSAVGKSLAELNLRARTGATVLAIGRGGGGFATPTPSEALAAGDVLALTGSDDALEAAKRTLGA